MAQTKAGLAQSFDLDKYTIDSTPIEQTITIEETGDSFQITYKVLGWAQRNKLIAKYLTWDDSGGTGFDADGYVRECLREMLIDTPWGKTTETFLISIDSRLGAALEQIVPQAFSNASQGDVDNVKKE
jgi:hypothetical protein|tara:strand:- start:366 stop:749 length:384 start_codon:yes stop_codon:yes gene_type:complete